MKRITAAILAASILMGACSGEYDRPRYINPATCTTPECDDFGSTGNDWENTP